MPSGVRPLIFQREKVTQREPLLIRWDLCPHRGGSTLGVLVFRHAESSPAEDVDDPLKPDLF